MSIGEHAQTAKGLDLTLPARVSIAAALLAGLALRLFFAWRYPFHSGDTFFYRSLADNWLYHGVYGLYTHGQLLPEDMRAPGYPAFIAAVHAFFGLNDFAVRVAQCLLDLLTCVLTALLAAQISPRISQRKVFLAALWMAALCPFTANYAASLTTETLATFATCAALLCLAHAHAASTAALAETEAGRSSTMRATALWFSAGLLAGLGALVRPETPILLAPFVLLLFLHAFRRRAWSRFWLFSLWSAAGLAICLSPWATRNVLSMGTVQFLAPRYAETSGDFVPRGFYAWTQTWLDRYHYSYSVVWKVNREPIAPGALPQQAFDSPEERSYTAALLERHNANRSVTPALDRAFAELARARTRRNPARTYVWIPAQRVLAFWFTPRMELLPFEPLLWAPKGEPWNNRPGFPCADVFEVLQIAYIALALAGAWRQRGNSLAVALVLFIAIRTAFLTQSPTVEPRYVIECFPALLALGAQVWSQSFAEAPDTPPQML